MWRGGGRIKGQGGRTRRRRTARERRAKEMKLGNIGGGLGGENKAERQRSGQAVSSFTAGRGQTGKKIAHVEINIPVALCLCVFLYDADKRREKIKTDRRWSLK